MHTLFLVHSKLDDLVAYTLIQLKSLHTDSLATDAHGRSDSEYISARTCDSIDEGALPHIGASHNRDRDNCAVRLHLLCIVCRLHVLDQVVQELTGAGAADGGHGDGLQSEAPEVCGLEVGLRSVLALVHR